jgi:gas vesicle protein
MFSYFKHKLAKYKRKQTRKIVVTSLLAGVVGSAVTFFTSKKNGEQNRKTFVEATKKMQKETEKGWEKLSDQVKEASNKASSEAGSIMSSLQEKVEKVKANLNNKKVIDVEVEVENKKDDKDKDKK